MGLEQNGLAAKEINAPEAVLKVTYKRQPGRTVTGIRPWSVVLFKYASDNIFIDVNSERFVDLLRDPGTAEPCIMPSPKAPTVGSIRQWHLSVPVKGLLALAFLFCARYTAIDTCVS